MVNYESIYPGALYTSPSPSYYTPPSPYQTSIENLGISMDPRTANQLGALNKALNPGVKTIEVQGISPAEWQSVPDQHLDEMRRLKELTGTDLTLHGELVDASGIGREGGFTEENRMDVEEKIKSQLSRAHKLDPKGNINVTFHSAVQLPEMRPHTMIDKDGKREKIEQGIFIIDETTGQIGPLKPEKRYFPEDGKFTEKEIVFEAKKELERKNKEAWTDSISGINRTNDFSDQHIREAKRLMPGDLYNKVGKIDLDQIKDKELFESAKRNVSTGQIYLRDAYKGMKSFFDRAWNNVKNEEDKKKLREFANFATSKVTDDIETNIERVDELKEVVERGLNTLSELNETPKLFKPLDEFAIEKSAETFANAAESSYKEFGSTAPIISIENPPAGDTGLSTGEDLKKLVVASRDQLTKNLIDKGMAKSEAGKVAEKMIGATWDVGHINMLRKKGYTEKELVKQTKEIAPYVKHVHLSDNFGLDHTELPMGMGNVPLKPMLDEIKKAGFKGKEIIEAGNWWQFFAENGGGNPFLPSIEAFDSPIYGMSQGPGWANTGVYGAYYSGHGPVNTPMHHQIYGSGFQNLPVELGGEIAGDRGRFAGAPNQ